MTSWKPTSSTRPSRTLSGENPHPPSPRPLPHAGSPPPRGSPQQWAATTARETRPRRPRVSPGPGPPPRAGRACSPRNQRSRTTRTRPVDRSATFHEAVPPLGEARKRGDGRGMIRPGNDGQVETKGCGRNRLGSDFKTLDGLNFTLYTPQLYP